jgi:hypothetical protein
MDALGIECQVHAGMKQGGTDQTKLIMDFMKKHFGMK